MSNTAGDGLGPRLRRLPGQVLLALVNGTAVLIIAAAILTIMVFSRAERFAGNIAATMTDAVLARVDVDPQQALANLQGLTAEVRTLGVTLKEVKAEEMSKLDPRLATLAERLDSLRVSVDRLTETKPLLTHEAISQLGRSVGDSLMRLRDCGPQNGAAVVSRQPLSSSPRSARALQNPTEIGSQSRARLPRRRQRDTPLGGIIGR